MKTANESGVLDRKLRIFISAITTEFGRTRHVAENVLSSRGDGPGHAEHLRDRTGRPESRAAQPDRRIFKIDLPSDPPIAMQIDELLGPSNPPSLLRVVNLSRETIERSLPVMLIASIDICRSMRRTMPSLGRTSVPRGSSRRAVMATWWRSPTGRDACPFDRPVRRSCPVGSARGRRWTVVATSRDEGLTRWRADVFQFEFKN
jgi:hypothetical protein